MNVLSLRLCGLTLAVVAGLNSITWAADRPSQSVLSAMGLGDLVVMTDSEGLSVRGFGYSPVKAAGWGWATVAMKGASAGSKNSYSAEGKHKAWGENASEAGVEITKSSGHGGGHKGGKGTTLGINAFSGGSSVAGRK